ncbi:MAG: Prolyl-tRNA editing protein ProX [Candidatus Heimdallarchaeota archaeon LC_3]|nr:MAG: Prolyl-tRNA editing protein ProX [Candidatus Heimdallarchaeota archaeon LC_3]
MKLYFLGLSQMSEKVYTFLDKKNIKYKIHDHPPVFTVEEAKQLRKNIQGLHCKNLFLKDSRRKMFYLVTTPADKKIVLKDLCTMIGAKKLTMASSENLKEFLGVGPGSVSPLGLINDTNSIVNFIIDNDVLNADVVNFHPNDNSKSVEFDIENFKKIVSSLNNPVKILDLE